MHYIIEHDWIKTPLSKFTGQLTTTAKDCETETASPEPNEEELEEKAIPFPLIGSGQSRLQSEFNYIGPIGKGGFGEVMKVQKLLDGRVYAIKRIQLNPKNQKLTKKIVREVKLLSRLDHENVVRYYNSWVEVMETTATAQKKSTSEEEEEDDEEIGQDDYNGDESSDKQHPPIQRQPSDPKQVTFGDPPHKKLFDRFLRPSHSSSPVPPAISDLNDASTSEWSFSHYVPDTDSEKGNQSDSDDDSDEVDFGDDDDNDDMFGTSFLPIEKEPWHDCAVDEDDSIVFQNSDDEESTEEREKNDKMESDSYENKSDSSDLVFKRKVNSDSIQTNSDPSPLDRGSKEEKEEGVDEVNTIKTEIEKKVQLQFLYIQMEYCDKQTLRSAIDEGNLYKDSKRLWRMFREIIEG